MTYEAMIFAVAWRNFMEGGRVFALARHLYGCHAIAKYVYENKGKFGVTSKALGQKIHREILPKRLDRNLIYAYLRKK